MCHPNLFLPLLFFVHIHTYMHAHLFKSVHHLFVVKKLCQFFCKSQAVRILVTSKTLVRHENEDCF